MFFLHKLFNLAKSASAQVKAYAKINFLLLYFIICPKCFKDTPDGESDSDTK